MALLLLILLAGSLVFLIYYEVLWKKFERERGKSLIGMFRDFAFSDARHGVMAQGVSYGANPWNDAKYRLMVEMHRRESLNAHSAGEVLGVSVATAEKYLDELEEEGRIQQAGDAERGVFYKAVSS